MDAEGNFPTDKPAYYQEDPQNRNEVAKEFEMWEMVHLKRNSMDGIPYGKPLFGAARLTWKRLTQGELDVSIQRKIRHGYRLLHVIGTADMPGKPEDIRQYKKLNEGVLKKPKNSTGDFYSDGRADIKRIEGLNSVDIKDLTYLEGILWIVAGVPGALTSGGREGATNLNVIKAQEDDYHRAIADLYRTIEVGLRQIFNLALALQLINPDSVEYVFKWSAQDRTTMESKLEHAALFQGLGYSFQTIFEYIALEGLTFEEELERLTEQKALGVIPYGIGVKPTLPSLQSSDPNTDDDEDSEMETWYRRVERGGDPTRRTGRAGESSDERYGDAPVTELWFANRESKVKSVVRAERLKSGIRAANPSELERVALHRVSTPKRRRSVKPVNARTVAAEMAWYAHESQKARVRSVVPPDRLKSGVSKRESGDKRLTGLRLVRGAPRRKVERMHPQPT